jgi:nucleotide-binding universal stress UspA family protein
MLSIRTILFPTDFSDRSLAAFDLACALARDYAAELVVAHVAVPPVPLAGEGLVVEPPSGWEEAERTELEAVRADDPRVRLTRRLLVGAPAEEIIRLAGEVKADLVVMGSHGRTGLRRLLAGSVAEAVMRAAPCPVLTVRTPFHVHPAGTPAAHAAVPATA